ncbi:MAG: DUF3450 family protein [Myxococcota bacterium]
MGDTRWRCVRTALVWMCCLIVGNMGMRQWGVAPALGKEKGRSLSQELARLRTEVEALSNQIEENKEGVSAMLKTLAMQRSALTLRLQKQRMSVRALLRRIRKQKQKIVNATRGAERFLPLFRNVSQALSTQIEQGLPFRVHERLEVVRGLVKKVHAELITPQPGLIAFVASLGR